MIYKKLSNFLQIYIWGSGRKCAGIAELIMEKKTTAALQ